VTDREPDADGRPVLDPAIVEDDELLGGAVDALILADPVARERAEQIAMHQGWLRSMVDPDVFRLVLEIEARLNERWADLSVVIARWAFEQGRRFPLPKNGGAP
jgi:hypothetical protein